MISKRPIYMMKLNRIFEKSLNQEKFCVAPTALIPGPTLLMVAKIVEKAETKLGESKEIRSKDKPNTKI